MLCILRHAFDMQTELKNQRVPVMMSIPELKALDAWRREQENLPSRGEAIRRLIEAGLAALSQQTQDLKNHGHIRRPPR